MHTVLRRLLLYQLLATGACNFSRLIELSQHLRLHGDIRSIAVFSQKSFVENLTGFDRFLRCQSATVPVVLINDDCTETEPLSRLIGSWSMAFVFMDNIDNANMLAVVNATLRSLHATKMIFVLEDSSEDYEAFMRFFKTCFHLGIVNVIVMHHNQVLSYEPFPKVRFHNQTLARIEEYFPDRLYNLNGYTFRSPIQQDGARVFMNNDNDTISKITGVNTEIFRSFVRRHNATFDRLANVTTQSSFDIADALPLLGEGKVDILLHTYSNFNPELYAWSYPIAQVQWQVVVPSVEEISSYMYLILPFDIEVWLCLAASFIYISLVGYITLRYCHQSQEYGPVFSRSLTQFLYMPSRPVPCSLRALLFEMQIFGYALILTNIYLAFLSAFLTTTVQGKQIDTFDELAKSGIQILTTEFESGLIKHSDVYRETIFRIEDMDFVNEYRKSLNRTYAFVMADDRTKFFLGQQKYLDKQRMHVSKGTLGTYFLTFAMQMDSPFQRNFDAILLQLYQTGLYKKWETDVFDLAVATNYLQIFRSENADGFRPLTLSYLVVCWIVYAVGMAFAFGVLLVEVMRFRGGKPR